ncbi:hypothetical protein VTI74DRAFT_1508 [Chaetomium olivicolor]
MDMLAPLMYVPYDDVNLLGHVPIPTIMVVRTSQILFRFSPSHDSCGATCGTRARLSRPNPAITAIDALIGLEVREDAFLSSPRGCISSGYNRPPTRLRAGWARKRPSGYLRAPVVVCARGFHAKTCMKFPPAAVVCEQACRREPSLWAPS